MRRRIQDDEHVPDRVPPELNVAQRAAGLARAAVGPAERLLTMVGHQRICAVAYAAAFAVNLIGCIVLAGPYGGLGVAAATSAAFVVESALLFLIEVLAPGMFMMWLGLSAILVGLISSAVIWSWQAQLIAFAVFAISESFLPVLPRFQSRLPSSSSQT